jgi:hypothetical protein
VLENHGSLDLGTLAEQQAQAEETAREALQRLQATQNSKTVDPRKREHKQVRLKGGSYQACTLQQR